MSIKFEDLTISQKEAFYQRLKDQKSEKMRLLGHAPHQIICYGIEDLTVATGARISEDCWDPIVGSIEEAKKSSVAKLRRVVVEHALGYAPIKDGDLINFLDQAFTEIPIDVYAADDIIVTAENPLIIDSNQSVTTFGTVTIEPGGYIEISVDCYFICTAMNVLQTASDSTSVSASGAIADIIITGKTGGNASGGTGGTAGVTGNNGSSAECDCCGGILQKNGTDGGDGGNGGNGLQGSAGSAGGNAPTVKLNVGTLTGTLTITNTGGNGGDGGDGGAGGAGGTGGKGGSDKTCGAYKGNGGNGGNGGDGGNGGNGGNGGQGGNGSTSELYYTAASNATKVIGSGSVGIGGSGGKGGAAGSGGAGGQNGGRNSKNGNAGDAGTAGVDGQGGSGGISTGSVNVIEE